MFGPTVSSRSLGPEPARRTTAGKGPAPFGIVSVPGSAHGSVPTLTSDSMNASGVTYAAGDGAGVGDPDAPGEPAGVGWPRWSPATRPSAVTATRRGTLAFANEACTVATVYGACSSVVTSPSSTNAPSWATIWAQSWSSAAAGAAARIVSSSIASAAAVSPLARASTKARPTAAGSLPGGPVGASDGGADDGPDAQPARPRATSATSTRRTTGFLRSGMRTSCGRPAAGAPATRRRSPRACRQRVTLAACDSCHA